MNRMPSSLSSEEAHHILPAQRLAHWSAEDFALARNLARAPLVVNGGLASARVWLDLAPEPAHAPVARVPLHLGDATVELAVADTALDHLAGLLEPRKPRHGAGRTLSLDGVEALLCALLAPLDQVEIGTAQWAETSRQPQSVAALFLAETAMPLTGSHTSINAMRAAFAAKMDRHVAAPLSYLKDAHRKTPAIDVQTVLGAVALLPSDRDRLETGGAVLLDSHWAGGVSVVAQRFRTSDEAAQPNETWQIASDCEAEKLLVRSAHATLPLDADVLRAQAKGATLELVMGDNVLAHGQLAALSIEDQPRIAFIISELFD